MEWIPRPEGINELLKLFNESRSANNNKHREIYEKINIYSKNKEFTNYLVYILNSENLEDWVRQMSGLTLKGIMERQFFEISDEDIEYFKKNILKFYIHDRPLIRKTISILINTFIRNGGLQLWPEILEFLYSKLDSDMSVSMSLETLIILIEDSANLIEEKYSEFLLNLYEKLAIYLNNNKNKIENILTDSKELPLINLVMKTLQTILENCSNSMTNYIEAIADSLISILNTKNYLIRIKIGRCLLTLIKLKNEIISNNASTICKIFNFFNENLSFENYDLNFLASEFYLYLIEDLNEEDSHRALEYLKENIKFITNYFFLFSKLTNNDICGEEIENKDCGMSESGSTFTGNTCINSEPDEFADDMEEEDLIEFTEGKINNYNKSWSLRKCCSKLLDKLSSLYPNEVLSIIQPFLENEIEDKNWLIKERSILTLGAISTGCYEGLKPNLVSLINFLLVELSHENKLIRAITCWTLSRYSSYIVSEESASLLPIYLIELLKRFLDSESIVQEAACAAFNIIITYHKDELSPYLKDVFKIITSTYSNFKGTGLIALYDCLILLTENFPESFLDLDCVSELIQGLIQRWNNFINMVKNDRDGTNVINDVSKVNFFDVIIALIRVSHELLYNKFDDFFNGCLLIINKLNDDKDIICRSLELISVIIMYMPNQFTKNFNKGQLIVIIFNLIKYDKDLGLKQYVIALIGDICKVDTTLLKNHVDRIIQILIQNLTLVYNKGSVKYDVNQISVCNNSCWTLGLIACNFKEKTNLYITSIMTKIIAIFGLPKLNKSLAQNAAILIGRLALVNSLEISKYIDSISKQFCLSIKFVPDGIEKQEAFKGLCQSVIQNPNGILKYFAFFCDCLCNYKSTDNELELLIQNIISSYMSLLGEKFAEYFNSFPEKLKQKMKLRFLFLN